ncbi:MAG: KH domain-containing protein [Bacilli bacterium]
MNYVELTEFLVSSIIENKDMLTVKEFDGLEDDSILLNVFVDTNDIGAVIGKQGKTANAIRTLVRASMHGDYKRIKIEFQSYDD